MFCVHNQSLKTKQTKQFQPIDEVFQSNFFMNHWKFICLV